MFRILMVGALVAAVTPAFGENAEDRPTFESLLKSGWEIAGYTGAVDNWSTFILFRHPTETHLIQCRAGYDVTREQRVQTNCYRLR